MFVRRDLFNENISLVYSEYNNFSLLALSENDKELKSNHKKAVDL